MVDCDGKLGRRFEFVRADVLANEVIARDTWKITVKAPEIAAQCAPGQFVMIRIAGRNDPLIGRALAMYDRQCDTNGHAISLSLVYVVKAKFTQALSGCSAGDSVEIWGPLGNGFSTAPTDHLIMVAGGVGQTPMLTLARAALGLEAYGSPSQPSGYAKRVTFCYGARTAAYLAGLDDFRSVGMDLQISTDDGSMGHHGRVTDVLTRLLDAGTAGCRIVCCGPEPMMEAVSEIAKRYAVSCEVSLETPMACGIGICFTCVAKVALPDGQWDYKRTCVEGPVFDASTLVW